ncbi:MAG TPA: hypothetical protein VJV79_35515 [Polyangiaceae bacterium]|nr:hypothetical protein [Polyangiaceae bacterium]
MPFTPKLPKPWRLPTLAASSLLAFLIDAPLALADEPSAPSPIASEKAAEHAAAQKKPNQDGPQKATDKSDDGWPDVSKFLDEKFGFLPIAKPITEPAVGYGVGGGLMFLSKPLGLAAKGLGRPNITGVGGFGTSNGSWGMFGMDLRYWANDRVQTLVAGVYASVNLDYYGTGKDSVLHDNPLRYNLQPAGGAGLAKYRLADSRVWAGAGYAFASTRVTFDAPEGTPALPSYEKRSNVGILLTTLTLDTRDNFFTPLRGTFLEAVFQPAATWLGADHNFERLNLTAIQYLPLPHRLFFGLRGDFGASFGDAPFYMRPSISMRGVAAMRYQGQHVAQLEGELRWQFYGRWSILGFMGVGDAWNHLQEAKDVQAVLAGGGGFRYEIARSYGLHMGVDAAFSRDTGAFYIQVGSAWMRP